MKLGYVLLYVKDVASSVEFFERAFGLERTFIHESGAYAEMQTGGTRLGFVDASLARESADFALVNAKEKPPGIEIGFLSKDVEADFKRAVDAGAVPVLAPKAKPWGQIVSYVRDLNGFLIEICTAID